MRITQGTFSYLPDLTDAQIRAQVQYCLDKGWAVNLEYTDDPHPRNTYWEMWGLPMFDIPDAAGVMLELDACRKAKAGSHYIRLSAFDNSARLGIDPPVLHHRPPGRRTRFRARTAGGRKPPHRLYHPRRATLRWPMTRST